MKKGILYILITAVLFSSTEVAVKCTGGAFNSIQLNFLRFLVGGLILLPMARKKLAAKRYHLTKADYILFAIAGFACVVISMTLYILSVSYVPASVAAILYASNTFFAIVFAAVFIKESVPKPVAIALVVCLIGVVAIINPFQFKGSIIGMTIGILSAITFSLYSVFGKKYTKGKPTSGIVLACYSFILGGIELGILMAFTHIPALSAFLSMHGLQVFASIPYFTGIHMNTIAMLMAISVLITGVGFAMFFVSMDTSVIWASLIFFIKPVLSPIIAYVVLHEVPATNEIIGIIFIVIGSIIIFKTNMHQTGAQLTAQIEMELEAVIEPESAIEPESVPV